MTPEIETRVRNHLADEAASVEVDVDALFQQVKPELGRKPERRRVVPLAVAATIAVGAVVASQLDLGETSDRQGVTTPGILVERTFSCPNTTVTDFATSEEDGFEPSLAGGPEEMAARNRAPRVEFVESGERAMAYLGDKTGVLGSIVSYAKDGKGEWRPLRVEACSGFGNSPLVPGSNKSTLGVHGGTPWPGEKFLDPRFCGTPVLLDHRSSYNLAGIVANQRSIYAGWCDDGLNVVAGSPAASMRFLADEAPGPQDLKDLMELSNLMVDPDDAVERENPWRLWGMVSSPDVELTLAVELRDGSSVPQQVFTSPDWEGQKLLAVLVPADQAETIVVTRDGETIRKPVSD